MYNSAILNNYVHTQSIIIMAKKRQMSQLLGIPHCIYTNTSNHTSTCMTYCPCLLLPRVHTRIAISRYTYMYVSIKETYSTALAVCVLQLDSSGPSYTLNENTKLLQRCIRQGK